MSARNGLARWGKYAVAVAAVAAAVLLLLRYHGNEMEGEDSGRRRPRSPAHVGADLQVAGPNILLIVVDALRPDYLGCYGGAVRTPNIDSLAGRGTVFERCFANAPWTAPSIASLLTSHHPSLCTEGEQFQFLASGVPTLAQALQSAGYRTGGVVSSPWLKEEFGFSRGFDEYVYARSREGDNAEGRAVTEMALRMLSNGNGRRFFLMVHYIDLHMPYGPPGRRYESQRKRELRRVGSPDCPLQPSSLEPADREYG